MMWSHSGELREVMLEILAERLAQKCGKMKRYWLLRINRCEESTLDRRNKPHEDK